MMSYSDLLYYQSRDKRYGVKISVEHIRHMREICAQALPNETGGILVGHYSDDCAWAEVTKIIGPSSGSIHRKRLFVRSNKGILSKLEKLWANNQYYIGEWHYHPLSSPSPSKTDLRTMIELSTNRDLHCPEPILIIIGGGPSSWTQHISVMASRKEQELALIEDKC